MERAARVGVSVVAELAMLGAAIVSWPFVALDDRLGWTSRGRERRAHQAHHARTPTAISDARSSRDVVAGTIELAGAGVRTPLASGELVWWSAFAVDGGIVRWVAGELAPFDLVDASGRVRIGFDHPREMSWVNGQRRTITDPPEAWTREARGQVEEWYLCWLEPGVRARASGFVDRDDRRAGYRDAGGAIPRLLADASGVRAMLSIDRGAPLEPQIW